MLLAGGKGIAALQWRAHDRTALTATSLWFHVTPVYPNALPPLL